MTKSTLADRARPQPYKDGDRFRVWLQRHGFDPADIIGVTLTGRRGTGDQPLYLAARCVVLDENGLRWPAARLDDLRPGRHHHDVAAEERWAPLIDGDGEPVTYRQVMDWADTIRPGVGRHIAALEFDMGLARLDVAKLTVYDLDDGKRYADATGEVAMTDSYVSLLAFPGWPTDADVRRVEHIERGRQPAVLPDDGGPG